MMFNHYLKTAWRNLKKNKLYSAINISGLAIGLAGCMLIISYIGHESSYDAFHKNANRIFVIAEKSSAGNEIIFSPMMSYGTAPLMKQNDGEVESFLRVYKPYVDAIVQNNEQVSLKFAEKKFLFADSNFFNFFSFKLVKGDSRTVLKNPLSIVISSKAAKKYFGDINAVGKIIRYNNKYNFTITGIAENVPSNSSIEFDFLASLSSIAFMDNEKLLTESQMVQAGGFFTYVLLKHPGDAHRLESILVELHKGASGNNYNGESYVASPLTDMHLNPSSTSSSNVKYLKVFPFVAALVLLLALMNYISLSTAKATVYAKEIGIRKVIGAGRKNIATQFFIESALYAVTAFIIGYLICIVIQPIFFNYLQIDIDSTFLHSPEMLLSFFELLVVSVVLAASYPSIFLSGYKPGIVLYGKFSKQSGGITIRKFFTVIQFIISIVLIICGIVIGKQMYFFRHTNTGLKTNNIVMIPFGISIGSHFSTVKGEMQSLASVRQVAAALYPMYKGYETYYTKAKNSNKDLSITRLSVDETFIPMLGLKWKEAPRDSLYYLKSNTIILNETAVEQLNYDGDVLNEKIQMVNRNFQVEGVLKDFNYETLQNKIGPLCIVISRDKDSLAAWAEEGGCLFAKINGQADMKTAIMDIKNIYKKYDNQKPFEYYFMDEAYEEMFTAEERLEKISDVFIAFTILIACFGLLGLVTFMAQQRVKEIGIRKLLGASVSNIVTLLIKDFLVLVLIAFIIASPVAWWGMNKWLQSFAYRINISWWMFALAGLCTVIIVLLTISFQSIKAALTNPVNTLRTK